MGLIDRLFSRKPPRPTAVEGASRIVERFATATSMGIDREDLAREFQLDETQMLSVFVVFIDTYFVMPITETGSISERVQGFYDKPEEREYLEAGSDVCRRWHEDDERRAPLELGERLQRA